MNTRKKLLSESGAIMLEVVAVLSLMGLMGTMLFRQMYVRNQELHNIQMASEIRVVKDAFASWIQAESTRLAARCPVGTGTTPADTLACVSICNIDGAVISDIKDFLPEGYFASESGVAIEPGELLKNNYSLKLVGYRRGTSDSNILTYYGVVVPKPSILPDNGEVNAGSWNFRRAARVAMLIGIDGGAYSSGVTGDEIAGAVGTWSLPIEGGSSCGHTNTNLIDETDIPTYVAITGTDVFQPEVDLPSLKIGLPNDWSLALENATAYGHFSAGGAGSGCYTLGTGGVREVEVEMRDGILATLTSDTIHTPGAAHHCYPAFYVEAGNTGDATDPKATGNVRVFNDLSVGYDYDGKKSAIRFDKDGMIVFENAEVADPQNPGKKVNYMLDPQYTSVMNDIKLMSRGGASLSDILPNYILKEQKIEYCDFGGNNYCYFDGSSSAIGSNPGMSGSARTATCPCRHNASSYSITITPAECPKGYKNALVVTPISGLGTYKKKGLNRGNVEIKNGTTTVATKIDADPSDDGADTEHSHFIMTDIGVGTLEINVKSNGTDVNLEAAIKDYTDLTSWEINPIYKVYDSWKIDGRLNEIKTYFNVQTYCVFDPANIDWNSDGSVTAADVSPTKTRTMDDTACGRIKEATVCANMGCQWDGSVCKAVAAGGGGGQ